MLGELGEQKDLITRMTPKYGPCEPTELRGRMLRAVASLGKEEVAKILAEDGQIEITCEFCKVTSVLKEADLAKAQGEVDAR